MLARPKSSRARGRRRPAGAYRSDHRRAAIPRRRRSQYRPQPVLRTDQLRVERARNAIDSAEACPSVPSGRATSPPTSRLSITSTARSDAAARPARCTRGTGPSQRRRRAGRTASTGRGWCREHPPRRARCDRPPPPGPRLARLTSAVRVDLERHHPPRGELFGGLQGGVADGRAHLQHIRVHRPAQRGKEAPRLPVNDRHGVALGHASISAITSERGGADRGGSAPRVRRESASPEVSALARRGSAAPRSAPG